MDGPVDGDEAETDGARRARTREAYDRLAPVWSATTDDGPFNGWLERPALRTLVPMPLDGRTVLDAGCGSGAQCEWLRSLGAEVVAVDFSPAMVAETRTRCGGHGTFLVADLAEPLDLRPQSVDGITCSLALHYLADWRVTLRSFADVLRPGGWVVASLDHPFAPPLPGQNGGYFETELVADTWVKAGVEVTQRFWRRPLAAVVDDFADAGFALDRLVEAQPSVEALARYPDELGPVVGVPWFIVYRLRLLGEAG
jgi:ubiquinone/menaquinone biosynthesis C-methylase UbiE